MKHPKKKMQKVFQILYFNQFFYMSEIITTSLNKQKQVIEASLNESAVRDVFERLHGKIEWNTALQAQLWKVMESLKLKVAQINAELWKHKLYENATTQAEMDSNNMARKIESRNPIRSTLNRVGKEALSATTEEYRADTRQRLLRELGLAELMTAHATPPKVAEAPIAPSPAIDTGKPQAQPAVAQKPPEKWALDGWLRNISRYLRGDRN